jgi:hypothetical protein
MTLPCPVCRGSQTHAFQTVDARHYWRCEICQATFLDPLQHPDRAEEKAEYDRHENDPANPGYRRFLARLAEPLIQRLVPGSRGLDYGCGPGAGLAQVFR